MAYTTLSAGLAADLVLVRGQTYYLTANITLGAYNVTTSGSSGRVTIKTDGTHQFQLNSTGTFIVDSIDLTSKNDDTKGESIAGSSGSPAAGDQTVGYVNQTGAATTAISMTNAWVYYCSITNGVIIGIYQVSSAGSTLTLVNGGMKYCAAAIGVNGYTPFIGQYTTTAINYGAITLTNWNVDNTNTINSATYGLVVCDIGGLGNVTITNCSFTPAGSCMAAVCLSMAGTAAITITNSLIVSNSPVAAGGGAIGLVQINERVAGKTLTTTISNSIISNTGTGHGIHISQLGGTHTAAVINDIITGCAGGTAVGLYKSDTPSITHTYNDYYGNTTNAFEALAGSETTANPILGKLPSGAVINTATCPFPDGYAVRNQALGGASSASIAALGFDATLNTPTGYRYDPYRIPPPGIMYAVTQFAQPQTCQVRMIG